MISIFKCDEHLRRAFAVFSEETQEKAMNIRLLKEQLPGVLQKTWAQENRDGESFSVLSLSGSTGIIDLPILSAVADQFSNESRKAVLHSEVVGSSHDTPAEYQTLVRALPENHAAIDFRFIEKSIAAYTTDEMKNSATRFDLVHFIHSFYYIPKEKHASVLEYVYQEKLCDKGLILIILPSEDNVVADVCRHAIQGYDDEVTRELFLTAANIRAIVERNKWRYEVLRDESLFDVTDLFEEGSEKGNLLLDFLAHYKDFRALGGEERVKSYLGVVDRRAFVHTDGRKKTKFPNDLIVVYKGL